MILVLFYPEKYGLNWEFEESISHTGFDSLEITPSVVGIFPRNLFPLLGFFSFIQIDILHTIFMRRKTRVTSLMAVFGGWASVNDVNSVKYKSKHGGNNTINADSRLLNKSRHDCMKCKEFSSSVSTGGPRELMGDLRILKVPHAI